MNTENTPELGLNKTGSKMSPINSLASIEGAETLTNPSAGDSTAIAENRIQYMRESGPVGSIPIPTSLKGAVSAVQEKILNGSHSFLDKMGERLAFERTGTRLYEALLSKYSAAGDSAKLPDLNRLEQFYLEELKHYQMMAEVIKKTGGDPTSMTPAADVSGTAALGWIQVMSDPRTTFLQSLEIILHVELVDNAGWELLIEMAEKNGLGEIAIQFQQCLDEEAFHLITVKQWVQDLTLNNQIDSPEQNFIIGEAAAEVKH